MNAIAYLQKAFLLAQNANAKDIRPNPFVGAIIVDENGEIKGEGYHKKLGEAMQKFMQYKKPLKTIQICLNVHYM